MTLSTDLTADLTADRIAAPNCAADKSRELFKLVFVGHVDHGKSTVLGRLLLDAGALPQGAVDRVKTVAAETGQPFEPAHLLDAFEEERRQGITIDSTQLQFRTARRGYVVIDAPGHKEFLKNMISGASEAEAAFLVVDAQRGVEEQTRRHARMLSLLGVNQVGLVVNKMDLAGWDQQVFERIAGELTEFLQAVGLTPAVATPVAALEGDNVSRPSARLAWFRGPTLLEALDGLTKISPDAGPLRLPLQAVYRFDERRILAGRVESGAVRRGEEILISPGGKRTKVAALAAWLDRDLREQAGPGESIGLVAADEFFNRRGEIVSRPDDAPLVTDRFKASLFWMGRRPLQIKRRYKLKLATAEAEAEVAQILRLVDSSTLKPLAADRGEIGADETAEVEIRLQKPLALDLFSRSKATGRFVIVDGFDVAGGGVVTSAEEGLTAESGFFEGALRARCEVFEEFYYDLGEMNVNKAPGPRPLYGVGDPTPLKGRSYEYPEFFDIVVFRDKMVVKIRRGLVAGLTPLDQHAYEGLPMVNGRGFALQVKSTEDWRLARAEWAEMTPEAEPLLAARWLDFTAYRRIPFGRGDLVI
ncbi:MAG: 50S ribosome-binding GTPase [Deltaproteobacteria bacterium]|jgi:sulfate adenylyltransferase subunit 1 (EFTu-like GTPase family)|nr:50S ribosome-binding GTPase [Deltaproteobacteria bacterium]